MRSGSTGRRDFLKHAGLMGSVAMMTGRPQSALGFGGDRGPVIEDAVLPAQPEEAPKYHIKFSVCGMSHDHIYGMVGAVQRGGGELVAAWGGEDDKLAAFTKRFPNAKIVKTQDEILNDPSIATGAELANRQPARAARNSRDEAWQGLLVRQAGHHHPGTTGRSAQDHCRDEAHLRHHVQRAAGGEGGSLRGQAHPAGRNRQGHPDHQHCAAPDLSASRRCRRRNRAGRIGSGVPSSMAEFSATSVRTRWTSFCFTRDRSRRK